MASSTLAKAVPEGIARNEKGSFDLGRNCPSHGQRREVPLTKPLSGAIYYR
jgi:hypothetical protein